MKAYLRTEQRNGKEWWVFFTWPLSFHVWWQSDGTKTKDEFFSEQLAAARKHNGRSPAW